MNHPLAQAYEQYIQSVEESRGIKQTARRAFGKELRAARVGLGMSVRELGEKVGITGGLINQVELSGKSILKKHIIERIVELCSEGNRSKQKSEGSNQSATGEGN